MNQCIHGIDLLRWTFGDEVDEVYGVTKRQFHDYLEVEDIGIAVVKFKNGAVATIEGTTNVYPQNLEETLYVFGEKGTVKIGGKSTNNIDVWNFKDESELDRKNKSLEEATSNVYGNGHTSLFADMIDAINNDRKPYIDAYAGRNALELAYCYLYFFHLRTSYYFICIFHTHCHWLFYDNIYTMFDTIQCYLCMLTTIRSNTN